MNTATLRNLARDFEDRLEWGQAAACYQRAIDAYPAVAGRAGGQLAKADIARMAGRRDACLAMAEIE